MLIPPAHGEVPLGCVVVLPRFSAILPLEAAVTRNLAVGDRVQRQQEAARRIGHHVVVVVRRQPGRDAVLRAAVEVDVQLAGVVVAVDRGAGGVAGVDGTLDVLGGGDATQAEAHEQGERLVRAPPAAERSEHFNLHAGVPPRAKRALPHECDPV
jgi:hypothetical protein